MPHGILTSPSRLLLFVVIQMDTTYVFSVALYIYRSFLKNVFFFSFKGGGGEQYCHSLSIFRYSFFLPLVEEDFRFSLFISFQNFFLIVPFRSYFVPGVFPSSFIGTGDLFFLFFFLLLRFIFFFFAPIYPIIASPKSFCTNEKKGYMGEWFYREGLHWSEDIVIGFACKR